MAVLSKRVVAIGRLTAVLALVLGTGTQLAFAGDARLSAADFGAYKESMTQIAAAEGQAVAQKTAIALMTLAWQGSAPEMSMADWTNAMAADEDAWLVAIRPFEGMTAAQIVAARGELPPFDLWP